MSETAVAAEFLGSSEFASANSSTNDGFVDGLYRETLGRSADTAGRADFPAQLQSGTARGEVARQILRTSEFNAILLDDSACLFDVQESLFQDYLERRADPPSRDFLVNALANGARVADVQLAILASDEYFGASG